MEKENQVVEESMAPISLGDLIPDGILQYIDELDQLQTVSVHSLAAGKRILIFVVSVALDPDCAVETVSAFIKWAETLKSKYDDDDEILCISANEPLGMKQWARIYPDTKHVKFLADSTANYARSLGLEPVPTDEGLLMRSKCFTLMVSSLKVYGIQVNDEVTGARTGADLAGIPSPCKKPRTEGPLSLPRQLISNYGIAEAMPTQDSIKTTEPVSFIIYSFKLPLDFAVALIGRDGSTISNIRMENKVEITINALRSEKLAIIIYGETSQAVAVVKKIKDLFAEHPGGGNIFSFPHLRLRGMTTAQAYVQP